MFHLAIRTVPMLIGLNLQPILLLSWLGELSAGRGWLFRLFVMSPKRCYHYVTQVKDIHFGEFNPRLDRPQFLTEFRELDQENSLLAIFTQQSYRFALRFPKAAPKMVVHFGCFLSASMFSCCSHFLRKLSQNSINLRRN